MQCGIVSIVRQQLRYSPHVAAMQRLLARKTGIMIASGNRDPRHHDRGPTHSHSHGLFLCVEPLAFRESHFRSHVLVSPGYTPNDMLVCWGRRRKCMPVAVVKKLVAVLGLSQSLVCILRSFSGMRKFERRDGWSSIEVKPANFRICFLEPQSLVRVHAHLVTVPSLLECATLLPAGLARFTSGPEFSVPFPFCIRGLWGIVFVLI